MISVVIKGPSFKEAHDQITKALPYADLIELRLDCFKELDLEAIKQLRSEFSIPMIFTLRSQSHGGIYTKSEDNRLLDIRRLASLKPEYFDLETHVAPGFLDEMIHLDIRLIYSYHNFKETPDDLEALYQEMRKRPAAYYKIAVMASNCLDALRLMTWAKYSKGPLIAISMGYHGQISRILSPLIGSPITYAGLEDEGAPGQLSAKTLIERYHYRSLTPQTALYGLIGNPVTQSVSDKTHNSLGLDIVYVKLEVKPEELPQFLKYAKELSFRGLSVTMPLKETILPYLDEINQKAAEIGAVNTLSFEEGKIFGFNTDADGALNALEKEGAVSCKEIVIIGAGGASKAIAYEAIKRGAKVTIVNRDASKAKALAEHLGCTGKELHEIPASYDILINCTPSPLPIRPEAILPKTLVMDIAVRPEESPFLKEAKEKGCRTIPGYQMFIEQALGQFDLWFKDRTVLQ